MNFTGLNADAHAGESQVRVSGDRREPLPGFDYADGQPFLTFHKQTTFNQP